MPTYNSLLFHPPAPVARVTLRNRDSGQSTDDVLMLIDTGADATLVPSVRLADLGSVIQPDRQYELVGFDGKVSLANAAQLELEFAGRKFRGLFLALTRNGESWGRDVLNSLTLLLDGPRLNWADHRPVKR